MKMLSKALAMSVLMTAAASTIPTMANAGVSIDINIAPPAPRVEEVPPPRVGYVWAPG